MKFVEKRRLAGLIQPVMDTTRGGGHHKIFTNERTEAVALRRWEVYAGDARRGRNKKVDGKSENEKKGKKERERKKKRRRTGTPRGGVVSVRSPRSLSTSVVSILLCLPSPPLPVGALVYRGYKQTRAGHTGEVTNAGHLHLAARVASSLSSLSLPSLPPFFPSLFLLNVIFPRSPSSFSSLSSFGPPRSTYRVSIFLSLRLSRPLVLFLCDSRAGCSRFGTRERVCARVCLCMYIYIYMCMYAGCIMYGGSVQSMVNTETPAGLPATCKFSAFKC